MDFKDILEKYKLGKVTEEEIKFIEDEIEKNRLINEYLMDEFEFNNNNFDKKYSEQGVKLSSIFIKVKNKVVKKRNLTYN